MVGKGLLKLFFPANYALLECLAVQDMPTFKFIVICFHMLDSSVSSSCRCVLLYGIPLVYTNYRPLYEHCFLYMRERKSFLICGTVIAVEKL